MRTIAECVEDIKSILNNVERTQEYTGETSVDINELVDEILSLNGTKDEARKPTYEGDGYYNGELVLDTWICPNCNKSYEVDYDDYDYCPNCGQHIDHSGLTEDD